MEQKNKGLYSSISVLPNHSIQEATSILKDAKIDAIPVIDDENCMVGVLTVQHIIAAISNGHSPSEPVENIMEAVVDGDNMKFDDILKNDGMLHDSSRIVSQRFSEKKLVENISKLYRSDI